MNSSTRRKKARPLDWHPADIVAALRKAGWSLRALSRARGYGATTLQNAMHRPYPAAERIIADAIGIPATKIWPSRYGPDGLPNRKPGPKPKSTRHTARRNEVQP